MKKAALIPAALLCSFAAFAVFFLTGTASMRDLMRQPNPELAWLKQEFKLGDAEYARIVNLHQAYLPQCARRCTTIEEQTRRLEKLLSESSEVTPEIREALAARAQTRAECETEMLAHFIAVSRTMPPEQGKRYLAWVEQQTFLRGSAMEQQHHDASGNCH